MGSLCDVSMENYIKAKYKCIDYIILPMFITNAFLCF